MSITKNEIKFIKSLAHKKSRYEHQLFVVEGIKGIEEFLDSPFILHELYTTDNRFSVPGKLITDKELQRISNLKTPNTALGIFRMPPDLHEVNNGLVLALDNVRDPGNLGTIIRLCDWFGIENLICSLGTVDCYNPKVVQATMGSLTRVQISYTDIKDYIIKNNMDVIGTFMNGENIFQASLPNNGIIIMGNEANGISPEIESLVTQRIGIPRYGNSQETESLNVATATAIVLSAFMGK